MPWLRRSVVLSTALVGALPVLLLAGATAWVGSNMTDIDARPRPAVLQLPAPTLSDERNAFFALSALSAEPGRDPAAVGQALWQTNLARAALPPQQRLNSAGHATLNQRVAAAAGPLLAAPSGPPLVCADPAGHCVAEWLADPVALAAQRQRMAMQGGRCEALSAPGMGFYELLPTPINMGANLAPHHKSVLACSTWRLSGAVLAWHQGGSQEAVALLELAGRMDAMALSGSNTLIANMVAATIARWTQATAVGLALRDPSLARQLASMPSPVTEASQVAAARRWIAHEAAFQQNATAELGECLDPDSAPMQQPAGWVERRLEWINGWQCRNRVGWLPERNKALTDDFWAGAATALSGGLPSAIQHVDRQAALAAQRGWRWRNTVGHMLVDLAAPNCGQYLRRAADLPLHAEAAALAVAAAAQRVPAPERAVWSQRQPLSAALRERLHWDESGQGFTVRTWYEEGRSTVIEPRAAMRFAWPAPIPS